MYYKIKIIKLNLWNFYNGCNDYKWVYFSDINNILKYYSVIIKLFERLILFKNMSFCLIRKGFFFLNYVCKNSFKILK